MRRLLGAAAIAALALPVASGAQSTPGAPAYPSRMLITADEWNLALSRTKLVPGPSIVELHNRGEDAHDVKIKRRGSKKVVAIPETGSEQTTRVQTSFRPGSRYVLWCSLPDHREAGMEAELRTGKG
jgi:hypothetical protein